MFLQFIGMLIVGQVIAALFMSVVWLVSYKMKNASIVDVVWSLLIALLALFYGTFLEGFGLRKFMITFMALAWGLRLSFHIFSRAVTHKTEDPRYTELRNKWGADQEKKMYQFFLLQGAVAAFLAIPFLIVCMNPYMTTSLFEWLGLVLWVIAIVGETLSDFQLAKFKNDSENKGKVCDVGLWRYSRHPNYFFEWLIWVSFAFYALGSPLGWISLICPIFMFHFLHNVTGVPKAEEQSLKSRGDAYREYQSKTSKFFPWIPKGRG